MVRGEPFSREVELTLVIGVVCFGGLTFLVFNGPVLWLLHWPLTRTLGTTAPIGAAVLHCLLGLRGRAAAVATGPGDLKSAIDEAGEADRVRIADHTDFAWDRLHVFGHYTPHREIEEALGFAWDDPFLLGVEGSEAHELFVFVKDRHVVQAYELFHGEGFCRKFDNHSWSRAEAVFEVADPSDRCLELPTSLDPLRTPRWIRTR